MKKPLGCLPTGGLIAGLLTVSLVVGFMLIWGGRLFSPGALNAQTGEALLGGVTSHAATGGNCGACHTAFWGSQTMADRCLACHTDVTTQLTDATSLHGAFNVGSASLPCYDCHPEHRGAAAMLTVVDTGTFPHDATGYSLKGHTERATGAAFTCADCHGPSLAHFDVATCTTCHTGLDASFMQDHLAAFAAGCLGCHDGLDTYGPNFDHNRVSFPLDGGHASLPCASCHTAAGSIAELQATPQDCFACHQKDDAHDGQFGQDCGGCHTPASWQQATFDHAKTAFPLTGAHIQVACAQCHANNVFKGTPTQCSACHPDPTYHAGLFGTDCASCHTTAAWSPAQFNQSHTFPIDHGERGSNTCQTCHPDALQSYTCYGGCHVHQEARTVAEHAEEGITNTQNCVQCHPTGRGEGRD